MSKKAIFFPALIIMTTLVFSGCVQRNQKIESERGGNNISENETKSETEKQEKAGGNCQSGKVNLPNYGDPGKRLSSCFVEYPGEPSRQDKSYYIVEDICGQLTKEFIEGLLGKKISRTEPSKISSVYACSYYLNNKEYVMLALDYLKVENQKIGQEAVGRKVEKNTKIPMDNFVVWQEDGAINNIYFILGPEKFLRLERSSKAALNNDEILDFSTKLGNELKNYK
jgi:hypothetical protein